MERRFQVFLSSTFWDLKEERLEVMKALLELDCIPCGMEYFPAASEDQWTYIQTLIDQCDYYVVIVAARYGSVADDGVSYTQKEYEYAVSKGVPVIAFLHRNPGEIGQARAEVAPDLRDKLEQFRRLCRTRLCKDWATVHELGAVVSRSLTQLIKRTPRVGWVRGDSLASEDATKQMLALRETVEEQRRELERLATAPIAGAEQWEQGSDIFSPEIHFRLTKPKKHYNDPHETKKPSVVCPVTWDQIFGSFAPNLLAGATEAHARRDIARMFKEAFATSAVKNAKGFDVTSASLSDTDFHTIKVQFLALGLLDVQLERRVRKKSKDTEEQEEHRIWQLTPRGTRHLFAVKAKRRSDSASSA